MNRADMLESLRKCQRCDHIRSSHGVLLSCGALVSDDEAHHRCQCPGYVPGDLSAEGKRMQVGR